MHGCPGTELLRLLLERSLSEGERVAVEAHVEGCASCQKMLEELTSDMEVFPQVLINIRVKERRRLEEMSGVQAAILSAETALTGAGRVLVRFSGTEPLARVMVEGRDPALVEKYSQSIAKAIELELA